MTRPAIYAAAIAIGAGLDYLHPAVAALAFATLVFLLTEVNE